MNTAGALQFLLYQVVNIYCYILVARALLQLVGADFYNPLSQFVVKATDPLARPLRYILPSPRGLDLASLFLIFALQGLILIIFSLVALGGIPLNPIQIIFELSRNFLRLLVNFYLFTIIVQAILSWFSAGFYNPTTILLHQLTEPVLRPLRKILPPMSGFDLSPMLAILLCYFIKILFQL